jgi:hypothetical protein
VGVDILEIVRAEQAADAALKEAQERKTLSIQKALADREAKLANIRAPEVQTPTLKVPKPNLNTLTEAAKRNRQKAVKVILEAFYET